MRLLPCGDRAWLVELPDAETRRRLDAALRAGTLPGVTEHVPAATTVLVRCEPGVRARVAEALRSLDLSAAGTQALEGRDVEVEVYYDGPDLGEVAEHLGIDVDEVVTRHTGQYWTCEFSGFTPGFCYLSGEREDLEVPRRDTPRTRIPAGSVGLAGTMSGIYPTASPGGWQLIGQTEARMWDQGRERPALVGPGDRVRFVAVTR